MDGAYIRRGILTEGNLRLKIDWASLIVGGKFTVFALFYFVFEGNFPSTSPRGGLYLEGRFNGGFFALPVWGAYIWKGLFLELYGCTYPWVYFFAPHLTQRNVNFMRHFFPNCGNPVRPRSRIYPEWSNFGQL